MDNRFTGRCDRSRQTPEKDGLYIILVGPVTECAFARWHIILPSCLDSVTSSHLFHLARGVCRRDFYRETFLKFINEFYHFMNF